jgi:hypothetical protein
MSKRSLEEFTIDEMNALLDRLPDNMDEQQTREWYSKETGIPLEEIQLYQGGVQPREPEEAEKPTYVSETVQRLWAERQALLERQKGRPITDEAIRRIQESRKHRANPGSLPRNSSSRSWEDVPEDVRAAAAMKAIEATHTELEGRQFLAKELDIPLESIPPGEMVTK